MFMYDVEKNEWSNLEKTLTDKCGYIETRCSNKIVALPDGNIFMSTGLATRIIDPRGLMNESRYHPQTSTRFLTEKEGYFDFNNSASAVGLVDGSVLCFAADGRVDTRNDITARYYPKSKKWRRVSKVNVNTWTCCIALANGNVLVAGGRLPCQGRCRTCECKIFNPASGRFRPTGSMHDARDEFAGCLLPNGDVFVNGGANAGNGCEIYRTQKGEWEVVGYTLFMRKGHACVCINNKVYIFGGINLGLQYGEYLAKCEVYDLQTNTSTEIAPMPMALQKFVAAPVFDR
jgi:hypothetical protein